METVRTYCCTECGTAFTLDSETENTPPILDCPACGTDTALRCSGWEKYVIQSSIYYMKECKRLQQQRKEETQP